MVKGTLDIIEAKIQRAEQELKKLDTILKVMVEAGEDTTALEIERDNLAGSIERWLKAIKTAREELK